MKSMMHIIYILLSISCILYIYIYLLLNIMHTMHRYIYIILNIMHTMHRYIYILCKKFDMMGKMPRVAIVKRWGESGSAGEVVVV